MHSVEVDLNPPSHVARVDGVVVGVSPHGWMDMGALEAEFIRAAGLYSERKGITYDAWRAAGVQPRVLKAAGVSRTQ